MAKVIEDRQKVEEYLRVYECMKQAVPDDTNMLAVMRACEFIIADCVSQANVNEDLEEKTYKSIADDVRNFVKAFKESQKHQGTMTTDYTPYVIIDDVTMSKVMELLSTAKCMAEKSYPHMTADFERVIKQVRERAECFTGSQNKPKTKKAYSV